MSRIVDSTGFLPLFYIKNWFWLVTSACFTSHGKKRTLVAGHRNYGNLLQDISSLASYWQKVSKISISLFSPLQLFTVLCLLFKSHNPMGTLKENHQPVWRRSHHWNSVALWATWWCSLTKSDPQGMGLAGQWGEPGPHRHSFLLQQRKPGVCTNAVLNFWVSEAFPSGWSCLRVKREK